MRIKNNNMYCAQVRSYRKKIKKFLIFISEIKFIIKIISHALEILIN